MTFNSFYPTHVPTCLKIASIVILDFKNRFRDVELDATVRVSLGLGKKKNGNGARSIDEQTNHDERAVDHVQPGFRRLLLGFAERCLVTVLDKGDYYAN